MKPSLSNPTLAAAAQIDPSSSPYALRGWEGGALVVNGTTATLAVTLPDSTATGAGVAPPVGCVYLFAKTNAGGNITVSPAGTDVINDGAGGTLASVVVSTQYTVRTLRYVGGGQWVLVDVASAPGGGDDFLVTQIFS